MNPISMMAMMVHSMVIPVAWFVTALRLPLLVPLEPHPVVQQHWRRVEQPHRGRRKMQRWKQQCKLRPLNASVRNHPPAAMSHTPLQLVRSTHTQRPPRAVPDSWERSVCPIENRMKMIYLTWMKGTPGRRMKKRGKICQAGSLAIVV